MQKELTKESFFNREKFLNKENYLDENNFYDINGQKERAAEIRRLVIKNHVKDIAEDGKPIGTKWLIGGGDPEKGGIAEWFYFCQGLWCEGKPYGELTEKIYPHFVQLKGYGTFEPLLCVLELIRNKDVLTKGQVKLFEEYSKKYMHLYVHPDSDLIGVNDNTPLLNISGLILAGEYFNNEEWLKLGIERLKRLKKMLNRRGFLSEYNSLTYTPLSIYALAITVNFAKNEEAKKLALEGEIRLWEHVAALYQPSVCQTTGPYARAYPQDKLAHSYSMRAILYTLLGDKCGVNPINTVFAEKPEEIDGKKPINQNFKNKLDENYYWQISASHIANMVYHCPVDIAEFMLNKSFPYIVRGTAEASVSADSHMITPPLGDGYASCENLMREDCFDVLSKQESVEEYAAGVISIYSYQDDTYSMGTATKEWHSGNQVDNFNILYSKDGIAHSQSEVGTVFANYTINGEYVLGNDMGRKIAMQHEKTAMVLYRPRYFKDKVSEAGLNVVFSNSSLIKEVHTGGKTFGAKEVNKADFCLTDKVVKPVFVHTGKIYLMILPLIAEKDIKNAEMQLKQEDENLILTLYNYKGEPKAFCKKGLCIMTNGFVCEVRREDEFKSFDEFISKMENCNVNDYMRSNIHTRYGVEREIRYDGADVSLECCISLPSDGIKYMTVNDELYEEIKFSAGGMEK